MTNLLQQAINCDDADRAARIIRDALGIESDDVRQLLLPDDLADWIASGAPVTSASGSRPRPAISRRDRSAPLPAALVRGGNRRRAIDPIAILLCIYQFVGGRVAAGFVAAEG